MGIGIEITKNKIPVETLEDDTLVELFYELIPQREEHKDIIRKILKTLLNRKKLSLLTDRRYPFNNNNIKM